MLVNKGNVEVSAKKDVSIFVFLESFIYLCSKGTKNSIKRRKQQKKMHNLTKMCNFIWSIQFFFVQLHQQQGNQDASRTSLIPRCFRD